MVISDDVNRDFDREQGWQDASEARPTQSYERIASIVVYYRGKLSLTFNRRILENAG